MSCHVRITGNKGAWTKIPTRLFGPAKTLSFILSVIRLKDFGMDK